MDYYGIIEIKLKIKGEPCQRRVAPTYDEDNDYAYSDYGITPPWEYYEEYVPVYYKDYKVIRFGYDKFKDGGIDIICPFNSAAECEEATKKYTSYLNKQIVNGNSISASYGIYSDIVKEFIDTELITDEIYYKDVEEDIINFETSECYW